MMIYGTNRKKELIKCLQKFLKRFLSSTNEKEKYKPVSGREKVIFANREQPISKWLPHFIGYSLRKQTNSFPSWWHRTVNLGERSESQSKVEK